MIAIVVGCCCWLFVLFVACLSFVVVVGVCLFVCLFVWLVGCLFVCLFVCLLLS